MKNGRLTSTQVAQRLGRSRHLVVRWCNQGRIKGAEKVGRDWFIPDPIPEIQGPQRRAYKPRKP